MGPTPTLPPNPKPPPTSRNQHNRRPSPNVDHDLVLDDVRSTSPDDPERDGEPALEETALRAQREVAEADATIRTTEEPEPLGRRLPAPLGATRQGVER